jgi:hypothetical protein
VQWKWWKWRVQVPFFDDKQPIHWICYGIYTTN